MDVTFIDGNRYTAKVVGTDAYNDIAVVQITDNITQSLKPLIIGNSLKLEVGEPVIGVSNPFGRLIPSSGLRFSIPAAIQTDAATNPGNSGGPLLNIQKQVIGMNTAGISASEESDFTGIGFAICNLV